MVGVITRQRCEETGGKGGFFEAYFFLAFNSICEKSNRRGNLYNVRKTREISRILEILGEGSCICPKPGGISV